MFEELLKQWANEQGFQTWSQDHAAVLRNLVAWLDYQAAEQPLALDLALPPAKDDVYKIEWLDGDTVRLTPSQ